MNMGSSTKRAWKLQEFVAHGGSVNCLALGHKSGRVMVSGGEDKKVNMWAVGKPNCIMSLSGHTSPVEAVRFGNAEEMVVAGSLSGALKIWDLEAAKIVRTLTGHKSSIRSLDFHPYGDFVASGSLDTNIKLWDIRRKGCIFTYKGHTNCVNSLRFSPDGRWIASAGEDGLLKLWDLTAGKLLTDFKQHTGPVHSVEFHPNEFLLASGSSDRTIKFWDLESFQLVSSTDGDSTPVRCVFFHPDGLCAYSGAQNQLKAYSWEPTRCYDTLDMNWGRVQDIAIAQNQLIGATFSQTNVSTYVVDLKRVQPVSGAPTTQLPTSPPMTASGRRSFMLVDRPPTQSTNSKRSEEPKEEPEEASSPTEDPGDDDASTADIQDPDDYHKIFNPVRQLAHSPTRMVEPFPAPLDDCPAPPVKVAAPTSGPERDKPKTAKPPRSSQGPAAAQPRTAGQAPPRTATHAQPRTAAPSQPRTTAPAPTPVQPQTAFKREPTAPPQTAVQPPPSAPVSRNDAITPEEFLPKQVLPSMDGGPSSGNISETEAVSSIAKGHDSMLAVLSSRSKNLQLVRALWTGGNTKTAVDSAVSMNDHAILVDILGVLTQKHSLWNLDLCASLLPRIKDLLDSKYENYVTVGCAALKVILRNFAPVIKSNISAPPSIGVDISREERYRKCKSCYHLLMDMRQAMDQKHHQRGSLAGRFREIQLLMGQLD